MSKNLNEIKIEEMYAKRRPMSWIMRETGYSDKKIKEYLQENGLWNGHKSMRLYTDEFFFDNIDTEEKAYWLGFIFADGYLTLPRTIGIELKSDELNHLNKFKQAVQSEHEIHVYNKNSTFGPQTNCRICFSSQHMFDILVGYFKSQRKTYEGEFPILKDESLIRHLIRGFFDGDGSISIHNDKNKNGTLKFNIGFTGRKSVLEYIEEQSGFNWSWSQRWPDRPVDNYQISCGRVDDSLKFLDYMYKDCTVYLDRKYEKYLQIKESRQSLSEN